MTNDLSVSPDRMNLVRAAAACTIGAIVIAALYFGRPLLMPFALAIVLAFALAPLDGFLRKWGLPRAVSVAATVLIGISVICGLGALIGVQVGRLAEDLPHYQANLTSKIESVRGAAGGNSVVEGASALFQNLNNTTLRETASALHAPLPNVSTSKKNPAPIPVEIRPPELTPFEVVESVADPLLNPLATLAIAIVFVVFILLQKEDLRSRFISLAGVRDLQRTSAAIDDGAQRLSRYLLLQTAVNVCVGTIIAIGLWLIGVPNPALWGLVAAILRFVPYVGVPVAATVPLALALAVDSGWTMVMLTAALYVTTEGIVGQVVEPWLYGRHMGLSPIAVVLSAAFWAWVWGPVGLLLSTPLTMCVVVLGRHVEHLSFLAVLLGNRPVLSPEENFYLRMLSGNPDEAARYAEIFLKERSLTNYFDEVAIKGLALAQLDINRGALNAEARATILMTVEGLLENLAEYHDPMATPFDSHGPGQGLPARATTAENTSVLCVAGRGPLDQAAAALLKCLLERQGIGTSVVPAEDASKLNVHSIDAGEIRTVCLSYLHPSDPTDARFLARRLRKQIPAVPFIAGFWSLTDNDSKSLDWVSEIGCDAAASNLASAVDLIGSISRERRTAPPLHPSLEVVGLRGVAEPLE